MAEILLTIKLILNTLYNIHKRERETTTIHLVFYSELACFKTQESR